ncbi:putative Zn(II)2Cys6 transcription factor [Glonium stellatum]|uniref:Putative Zn(II)2Cys6 transcription factor n=1 Tax=Glonium stellatum TaxID=574774 RepID=A0A8E2EXZ4_9PEZI|nr:putative Zn(II)2Cys6 transcription factor [Glonium stellatum]
MDTDFAHTRQHITASSSKQAACLNCRRSKVRCRRNANNSRCERCQQAETECVIPEFHVGRQKGVKNKRTGLDRALHQIEQAIKKSSAVGADPSNENEVLKKLLAEAQNHTSQNRSDVQSVDHVLLSNLSASQEPPSEDNLALDDAENPLQLLARSSDLRLSQSTSINESISPTPSSQPSTPGHMINRPNQFLVDGFFVPITANPDTSKAIAEDIDPIDIGLATIEEADALFAFFYQNLSHARWGLDPLVHSFQFVRSQSAFLFTSILAASALFLQSASALSKRLSAHRALLARRVTSNRNRSVEIVLAFMVNVPWMSPGKNSTDDETCSYAAIALSIALDLSLNKIVVPSSSFDNSLFKRLARADTIDARRALYMDGFSDVDPASKWGQRLLRRRERAWISLFVLERGVCLARGRSYTVPKTPLIEHCNNWHESDVADIQDGSITSMAVLRRDLDSLFNSVRSRCDSYRITDVGAEIAQSIRTTIEEFYNKWYTTWAFTIGEGEQRILPPYVEILVIHTRLSTYSGVINHPTAPVEVKQFFRAAGLSSALNVMRAAIQGETRLKSMPNNTAIMISFAACFALSLSAGTTRYDSYLAPSVKNLIMETADVLERIGATPSHRNGASVLYGRYLRELIRRASKTYLTQSHTRVSVAANAPLASPSVQRYSPLLPTDATTDHTEYNDTDFPSGELQFSAMSDNQIIEAISRANTVWDMPISNGELDEMTGLDWFDWGNPEFGF